MQLKANVTRRDKVLFSKHVFVKLNTCHHNSLLRIYTTLIMKVYYNASYCIGLMRNFFTANNEVILVM